MRRSTLVFLSSALVLAGVPETRPMSLTSPDGFVLKGTLTLPVRPGLRPVVVLAPQFQATRAGWKALGDRLTAAGIATLALDLRGHGESTLRAGQPVAVSADFMASAEAVGFDRIPGDLAQACAWVRRQPGIDGRRLGLAGASLGGFSVLMAMPQTRPLAVLALSPAGTGAFGPNARADLVRAVERGHAAVMVMASQDDTDAAANAAALGAVPGVYTRLVPGEAHGFAYLDGQSDTMATFFGEYLNRQPALVAAP